MNEAELNGASSNSPATPKPVQGPAEDFGDRLRATHRRLAKNHGLAATSRPAGAETFAGKVADAVKARLAQRSPRRVTQ